MSELNIGRTTHYLRLRLRNDDPKMEGPALQTITMSNDAPFAPVNVGEEIVLEQPLGNFKFDGSIKGTVRKVTHKFMGDGDLVKLQHVIETDIDLHA